MHWISLLHGTFHAHNPKYPQIKHLRLHLHHQLPLPLEKSAAFCRFNLVDSLLRCSSIAAPTASIFCWCFFPALLLPLPLAFFPSTACTAVTGAVAFTTKIRCLQLLIKSRRFCSAAPPVPQRRCSYFSRSRRFISLAFRLPSISLPNHTPTQLSFFL